MMKTKMRWTASVALLAMLLLAVALPVHAKKKPAPAPLTEQGESLKADYTKQMESLQKGLLNAMPNVSDAAKAEYKSALAAEAKAKADLASANAQLGKIASAKGLIGHAKNHWIPKADRGIKAGKQALSKAKTQAERDMTSSRHAPSRNCANWASRRAIRRSPRTPWRRP